MGGWPGCCFTLHTCFRLLLRGQIAIAVVGDCPRFVDRVHLKVQHTPLGTWDLGTEMDIQQLQTASSAQFNSAA